MTVSNQIQKYRLESQLTQDILAEKVYVSRQTISNWETGRSLPDINSLILLSLIFDCSLDDLLIEENQLIANKKIINDRTVEIYIDAQKVVHATLNGKEIANLDKSLIISFTNSIKKYNLKQKRIYFQPASLPRIAIYLDNQKRYVLERILEQFKNDYVILEGPIKSTHKLLHFKFGLLNKGTLVGKVEWMNNNTIHLMILDDHFIEDCIVILMTLIKCHKG